MVAAEGTRGHDPETPVPSVRRIPAARTASSDPENACVTFHPRKRATNALAGSLPDVGGGADLLDAAVVHHDEPVGERERLVVIVGHEQDRESEPHEQGSQLGDEPLAQRAVEGAERFVEHEQPRRRRQRACEGDPLLLATGELRDAPVLEATHADERQRVARTRVSSSLRGTPCMRSPKATLPCTSRWGNSA